MAILDELVILLGLQADAKNESVAKGFSDQAAGIVTSVANSAQKAGKFILGAVTGFAAFSYIVGATTAKTALFAKDINASFEGLQELRFAAEMSGRSVDELNSDLKKISDAQKAPYGVGMGYRMLGVSLTEAGGKARDVTSVMMDLSGKIQGMSDRRTRLIQEQLGFSDDTIRVLKQGPEALKALAKEGRDLGAILPESAGQAAIKYNETITRLKKSFEALSFRIGSTFLPVLKDGVEWLQKMFAASQRWIGSRIEEFTKGVSDAFTRVKNVLIDVWQRLSPITDKFEALGEGLDMVQVFSNAIVAALAIAVAAFAPAIGSAIAMTAAITALGLVVDDLINYFEGGESVIGSALDSIKEKFPDIYEAGVKVVDFIKGTFMKVFPAVAKVARGAWDLLVSTVELVAVGVNKLFELMSSSDVTWISKFVDVFVSLLNLAGELLSAVADIFKAWVEGKDVDWSGIGARLYAALKDAVTKLGELFKALATGIGKAVKDALVAAFDWAKGRMASLFGWDSDEKSEERNHMRPTLQNTAAPAQEDPTVGVQSKASVVTGEGTRYRPAGTTTVSGGVPTEAINRYSAEQFRPQPFGISQTPSEAVVERYRSAYQPSSSDTKAAPAVIKLINQAPALAEKVKEVKETVQSSQSETIQPLPATATQQAGNTVTDNSRREQNNTFNIQGSDAQSTANIISSKLKSSAGFLQSKSPGVQRGTF